MKTLWCNGQWLPPADFPSSPLDRGMTLGLGLFETILALDGRPVFFDQHLERMHRGCTRLGWMLEFTELEHAARELLVRNDLTAGRARIRLAITAGAGTLNTLTQGSDSLLWMIALPVTESPPEIRATIAPWPRNEHSALAGLKCNSYAENLVALAHARRAGFQESIFLNTAGHLCEAATANLFLVKKQVLLTPPLTAGCLAGIARDMVLKLAHNSEIESRTTPLTLQDLHTADEVFLTSSINGLASVSQIDATSYPLGPLTRRLRESWNTEITRAAAE